MDLQLFNPGVFVREYPRDKGKFHPGSDRHYYIVNSSYGLRNGHVKIQEKEDSLIFFPSDNFSFPKQFIFFISELFFPGGNRYTL